MTSDTSRTLQSVEPSLNAGPPAAPPSTEGVGSWARRAAVLFTVVLTMLVALPFPFGNFGIPSPAAGWWEALWTPVVPWVARHLLGVSTPFPRYSGGETTWDYIQFGTSLVIAAVAAVVWATADRGRSDLRRIDRWFRTYLRLFLAAVLFAYGWSKVFPVQFPALGPERLSQTFGEASPHGLLWAFMGYSRSYMTFAGLGEVTAAILLCSRRTATLGALVGVVVMTNVVMLNFAFDVGVKLASTFYLFGLIYLALPAVRRLVDVLLLDRPVLPTAPPQLSATERRLTIAASCAALAYAGALGACAAWRSAHDWGQWADRPPLYGLYDVVSVVRVPGSSEAVDPTRWTRVAIGQQGSTVRQANGELGAYVTKVDTSAHTIRFASRDSATVTHIFAYERPDTAHVLLRRQAGADSISLLLRRRDERTYRLVSHPFHWVQDTNENR